MAGGHESIQIPTLLQNIGCQELLTEDSCSHCGWLRKRPSIKKLSLFFNWHQAYVVLNDGCLYYFKSERAKSPSGKFCLYGYNSVFRASDIQAKETPWAFKIVHSHREFKTYYFSASSEREMKTWMTNIKRELMRANGKNLQQCYIYGKPAAEEKEEDDDNKFYQEVEKNIYDDTAKFQLPSNYSKQYGVKKGDEDSDDEDLNNNAPLNIDARPPAPLPGQKDITNRGPVPLPRPGVDKGKGLPTGQRGPAKPPRLPELPPTPLKEGFDGANGPAKDNKKNGVKNLSAELESKLQLKSENNRSPSRSPRNRRRRGSYIDPELADPNGMLAPVVFPQGHEHRNYPRKKKKEDASTRKGAVSPSPAQDLDDLENMDGEIYWSSIYFDEGDKQKAHEILLSIAEDGVYLVRPEGNDKNKKVLVVFAEEQTKKYRIQQSEAGEYYIQREGGYRNSSLEEMLAYYYDVPLPTVHVYLTIPYKLHKKYRELYT